MSAPDFYFAINALFRYLHDTRGRAALIDYWHQIGADYYVERTARWRTGGTEAVASDWREYFAKEPGAQVAVSHNARSVTLDVLVCPAILHLRSHQREIVPYFCEHCDHVCSAMAGNAEMTFSRTGGMGSCRQVFTCLDGGA